MANEEIIDAEVVEDEGELITEIYYMLCYHVQSKRWYAAPYMIQVFTQGAGEVLEGNGLSGKWRPLEDGLEKDIDFDNIELISAFLRKANNLDGTNQESPQQILGQEVDAE